ncbi:undecaprenyl-diphosphatase [Nakamurella sp. UYEF19]|uniref:phosphatase PAP2 family protein n=1 Tax=Nakamurella sp. UYEF19 TaxID=1756392 RepID=UPI00339B76C8
MEHQPEPTLHQPKHLFGLRTTLIAAGALVAVVPLAVLIVLISTGWTPLHTIDLNAVQSLNRYAENHAGQVQFWKIVSIIGGPTVLRIAAVLAVVLLWIRHRRAAAVLVAVAIGGAAALSGIFKLLVNRGRPVVAVPVEHADSASFPSGHALTSFVAAGVLLILLLPHLSGWRRALLIAAAVLLCTAVGFSRLLLGVHYPSDVLGSWLIGTALLLILAGVFHRSPASHPAAPTPPTALR